MSNRKSYEERLEILEKKEKELAAQKKKIKAQQSAETRKARTKHLIEIGGAVYSVLGRQFVDGDVDRLIAFLNGQESRGNYFSSAMNNDETKTSE